jgi:uncharacterized damage-inducible protein DinB
MTYYGGKEMASAFRTVRANTVKIADEVPENKYDFRAAPGTRTIGQTLSHIAVGTGFQLHMHANKIDDLAKVDFPELVQKLTTEESKPRTKAEMIALLNSEGQKFASFLEGLSDDFLAQVVAAPPGAPTTAKTRFEMLLSAKEHEMHCRAQLMVLQRMIGQVPHLTRQMQERRAQMQAGAQQAR